MALYNAAVAECERENVPIVGDCFDGRSFGHLYEVFQEDNCSTLMCFICSCKHVCHSGFDTFGRPYQKGSISYRSDVGGLLRASLSSSSHIAWNYNLPMKRFRSHFGDAVQMDPYLETYEWKRWVGREDSVAEVLCCPGRRLTDFQVQARRAHDLLSVRDSDLQ